MSLASLPGRAVRSVLGEALTLTHGAETRVVRGSFSTRYEDMLGPDMTPISARRDRALVAVADLAGLPLRGYTLTRADGEAYTVRAVQPNGIGNARLVLDKING